MTVTPPASRKGARGTKQRETVEWFADMMELVLQANDFKGGWEDCEVEYLLFKLGEEYAELYMAIKESKKSEITKEAADLANVAMMLADRNRRRA